MKEERRSKTTESKHGKTRLSYLDVDKDWFRPANRGDIKKIKEQICGIVSRCLSSKLEFAI